MSELDLLGQVQRAAPGSAICVRARLLGVPVFIKRRPITAENDCPDVLQPGPIDPRHTATNWRREAQFFERLQALPREQRPLLVEYVGVLRRIFQTSDREVEESWLVTVAGLMDGVAALRGEVLRLDAFLDQSWDALSSLHAAGIVHMDAQPKNFVLAADGSVLLIDLGSSIDVLRELDERSSGYRELAILDLAAVVATTHAVLQAANTNPAGFRAQYGPVIESFWRWYQAENLGEDFCNEMLALLSQARPDRRWEPALPS